MRALLVAIDKYPDNSGWNPIHATNDIKLIKPVLLKRGFSNSNIITLTNEQATKKSITRALRKLSKESRKDDRIYIHFSCHGQQMADNNGDEADNLDEALIPYDAPRRYQKGIYEGVNHLRDDELGVLLDSIRRRIGKDGEVILTLDACHSGTGDRDSDEDIYVRGTSYIFAPEDFNIVDKSFESAIYDIPSAPAMAAIVVIAACMPSQLNYEYRSPATGTYYGSLTYALCEILKSGEPVTFGVLESKLKTHVARLAPRRGKAQNPLINTDDKKRVYRIGM